MKKEKNAPWVAFVELRKLCAMSDIVSIHIPLDDTTRGLINMELFTLMKPDSYIVNASRGGVINEEDLIEALDKGLCSGAGLDVFEKEPVDKDNPLLQMENVILTPHTAALTGECVARRLAGDDSVAPAAMAKNTATDMCSWVCDQAVQIHGGAGYMRETVVERLYRDARLYPIGGGTREIMNEIISKAERY